MKEYLQYNPSSPSGLVWLVSRGRLAKKGSVAGTLRPDGYYEVILNRKHLKVHRVIWELLNGPIPRGVEIDHIDCNPSNNLVQNLRLATRQENNWNKRKLKVGTSSYKGVSFFAKAGKWRAQIRIGGKKTHLGLFLSEQEAAAAYRDAATQHFGQFTTE